MGKAVFSDLIYNELKTTSKLRADGSNFCTWKLKLDFYLSEITAGYVLRYPQPEPGSPKYTAEVYDNWIYYDSFCRNIILDVVDNDIRLPLKDVSTARSLIDALEAKFASHLLQEADLLVSNPSHRMCHISEMNSRRKAFGMVNELLRLTVKMGDCSKKMKKDYSVECTLITAFGLGFLAALLLKC